MTEPATLASDSGSSEPRAAVHDLGYRRYLGSRRPQSTRWRAVVKNMLRMAWQGFWRAKAWLFGALTVVVAIGFLMAIGLDAASKASVGGGRVASQDMLARVLDEALAKSFLFLPWLAFILTMTAVARTVARDFGAGAFEFYFSRPVRAIDYVIGKLGGALVLVGAQLFLAPVLLAVFRVAIDWDNAGDHWLMIPQTALIGGLATLFFASVPLALSSLVAKPRSALILWAVLWVLVSGIARAAAATTGISALYAFDPYGLILGITYGFYGMRELAFRGLPTLGFSIVCLLGYFALSAAVLYWRVRSIERAGIGGRG